MRSISVLAGSAVLGAAFALSTPVAAHAAHFAPSAPMGNQCEQLKGEALEAQDDYEAARKQYEEGDKSLRQEVGEAEQNANRLASEAQRACGDTVMDPDHSERKHPRGAMHTGTGGTSDANSTEIAIGVGVAGALGAGVLLMTRRRNDRRG